MKSKNGNGTTEPTISIQWSRFSIIFMYRARHTHTQRARFFSCAIFTISSVHILHITLFSRLFSVLSFHCLLFARAPHFVGAVLRLMSKITARKVLFFSHLHERAHWRTEYQHFDRRSKWIFSHFKALCIYMLCVFVYRNGERGREWVKLKACTVLCASFITSTGPEQQQQK